MAHRSGTADLPLHGGQVQHWLAARMARLGRHESRQSPDRGGGAVWNQRRAAGLRDNGERTARQQLKLKF